LKKVTLIFFFTFWFGNAFSQVRPVSPNPGVPKSTEKKYQPAKTQAALVNKLLHDTCLDKKFSLIFYLIEDSAGTLITPQSAPIIQAKLNATVAYLNTAFKNICVSFEFCKMVVIPNYNYNQWKSNGNGQAAINNYYMANTLGIYLPDAMLSPQPDIPEYTYVYTTPPVGSNSVVVVNAIVIQNDKLFQANETGFIGAPLLHAVGHFFGLPHTFDEINPAGASTVTPLPPSNASPPVGTLEYVNRVNMQNCLEHGDGFCDTDADPYPSVATAPTYTSGMWNCSVTKGLKDGHGDFYLPPCDNLMSYYSALRCRFTQQQYNYMAYFIMTRRMYLH